MVSQTTTEQMAETCLGEIVDLLGARSAALYVEQDGRAVRLPGGAGRRRRSTPRSTSARRCALPPATGSRRRRRRATAGCTCRCAAPRASAACSPCRHAATDAPTGQSDTRLVASLGNLVGAFLERERLQQAATTAAAAQEADQLKSSLLSSVSHELKTPLAALTATVSNLLESDVDWDEESVRDELRAIVGDVARLNTSITALLELSRLEAHAWEPRNELYGLGEIVFAGIDALPAHLQERVRVDIPERTSSSTSTSCSSRGSSRRCWRTRCSTRTAR